MGIMRCVLACIFAVLAIFIGILLVIGGSAQIFLHPGAYQHALQESGAYKVVDEMNTNKSMMGTAVFIKGDLRNILDQFIVEALAYVRGARDEASVVVEIDTQALHTFFEESAEQFPVCSSGQEAFVEGEPQCRPQGQSTSAFVDEVLERQNKSFFESDKLDLMSIYDPQGGLHEVRDRISVYYLSWYSGLALWVVLLAGLFFVQRSVSSRKGIRWVGTTLILVGLLSALFIFIGSSVGKEFALSHLPSEGIASEGEAFQKVGIAFVTALIGVFLSTVAWVGGSMIVLGIAFWGISWKMNGKSAERKVS